MPDRDSDDVAAIRQLIMRQFASLSWSPDKPAGWANFHDDFHESEVLYAAARPARAQSPGAFITRMQALAGSSLRSFQEGLLGAEIKVFGNVAVAVAACETVENGADVNRNVEMLLLVREDGRWKIAAQAWDKASESLPIPGDLLAG